MIRVVVAAHDVQAVAERRAVARLERRPLLGPAVDRQIPLHHDRIEPGREHLFGGGPVHHLRVGRLVGPGSDAAHLVGGQRVVEETRLGLTEMDVVHRAEAAEQFTGGPRQRAAAAPGELELGVRRQPVEPVHHRAVVDDGEIVGDGRQVHGRSAGAKRSRRHHRPLNRHAADRSPRLVTTAPDFGQSASTAATMAAASSSVGAGEISVAGMTATLVHAARWVATGAPLLTSAP